MEPVFADAEDGLRAIRDFAAERLRGIGDTDRQEAPADVTFEASMPNGAEQVAAMEAAGWRRTGEVEYAVDVRAWSDARGPLAGAMGAAMAALAPHWVGASSAAAAAEL